MVARKRKKVCSPVLWIRSGKRLVRRCCDSNLSNQSVDSNKITNCNSENGALPSKAGEPSCIIVKNQKTTSDAVTDINEEEKSHTINFVDLPEECLVIVLSFLNLNEICRVSTICKKLYQASKHPGLWWNADFRFVSMLSTKFIAVDALEVETLITNVQRRKMFATFLAKRKAAIKSLFIDFDACEEGDVVVNVLEQCNVKNLTSVEMKWWKSWDCLVDERSVKKVSAFQQILHKLLEHCPKIKSLKCEIDLSGKTARLISKFKSIESLSLVFLRMCKSMYNRVEYGMKNSHLETIISSLPLLQHLKIRTRQSVPDEFPGYLVKSSALKSFDCSWCKCFRICELDLPNLHTFKGINSFDFRSSQPCPCLFKLIEKGCPSIRQLNMKKFEVTGLKNFGLSNIQKQQMFICSCPDHAPWRENV